mmetsp:Transcript_12594/g.46528  ORF Transcript_12594/g.46528 Transcript_12594/m.46528 type:complete len:142 (-) Transcript_12594:1291-1716(-)
MCWDYHVLVTMEDSSGEVLAFDFDSTLPFGGLWSEYLSQAFPPLIMHFFSEQYRPMFRRVPARTYLEYFASDRSHMRGEDGEFLEPPPGYDCLRGPKAPKAMMLHDFLSFGQKTFDFLPEPETLSLLLGIDGAEASPASAS